MTSSTTRRPSAVAITTSTVPVPPPPAYMPVTPPLPSPRRLPGAVSRLSPAPGPPGPLDGRYGCRCDGCYQREAVMKRTIQNCESPLSKEPPTKIRRYHTLADQSPGVPPVNITDIEDDDDDRTDNRRCAGTQTSFSSFPPEQYAQVHPGDYRILSLDPPPKSRPEMSSLKQSTHQLCCTPPPGASMTSYPVSTSPSLSCSPHSNSHSPVHMASDDSNSAPLNLTTNQQLRPSVITIAPSAYVNHRMSSSPPRGRHSPDTSRSIRREAKTVVPVSSDPAIEEHFRRSLGPKYAGVYGSERGTLLVQHSPPSNCSPLAPPPHPPPPPPMYQPPTPLTPPREQSVNNLSIDGSVDDHFAKSLGPKWKQINAEPEPAEVFPGSVDDHFAKALGPAWLRIKAEKEGSDCSCPSTPSPTHSNQSHPSMVMS